MKHLIFLVFIFLFKSVISQEIDRFERITTKDGLSQNTILSSYSDSQGFLWFGTMDGLNRYDGYNFHIYRKKVSDPFSITSNRIVEIWEDSNKFIWVESHDGHYHYLDRTTDKFYSFPKSEEIKNNKNIRITSFFELNDTEIWLGTDNSGVYQLVKNKNGIYDSRHFSSRGVPSLSNDKIKFIIADSDSNIWIGTEKGINKVSETNENITFQHFLIDYSFTSAVAFDNKVWFGTEDTCMFLHDLKTKEFTPSVITPTNEQVSILKKSKTNQLIIGTKNSGLKIFNPKSNKLAHYFKNQFIKEIYETSIGNLWLITNDHGISRLDFENSIEQHFALVPEESIPLVIDERQVFFEDNEGNIWIGSHGGGLAMFDSKKSTMSFFRNNPKDNFSISSDIVHSITQDEAGLIWVGTGQSNGGLNKIVPKNPLFTQLQPENEIESINDYVIKGMLQDSKNNIWVASKSGNIFIYNQSYQLINEFDKEHNLNSNIPESHVYSIMQDNKGFIWLGSKSKGVAVSQHPLSYYSNYTEIKFYSYKHKQEEITSLSNDFVYSIIQDNQGKIWIGTYGGGVNVVESRTSNNLICKRLNKENSGLSSNEIRQIYQDKSDRIWFATTFGLNVLKSSNSSTFKSFTNDESNKNSISYNDVVCVFEDNKNKMWFGTFGGGLNYFIDSKDFDKGFNHLTTENGLINDAVFGIIQDNQNKMWFSTQNGISKFDTNNNNFENFDTFNGLVNSEFNENSNLILDNGKILYGNTSGILAINPGVVITNSFQPKVVFTNFLIFNKEVDIKDEKSPIQKKINYVNEVVLEHNRSSFSIEYSALSFFDSKKNQFSYTLENFDPTWYNVRNEHKASYTNVPPGDYIFKLKALNWNGTWNDTPRVLKIKILRPWWTTNIAFFTYFLVGALIVFVLTRAYINYRKLQTNLKVEKRVNEIKLQFFTNISHEIRTPLTLILGPIEDLKNISNLPHSFANPLNIMNRNGKRILRLVNQLLDFRKIQNQKMKLRVQRVEMFQFVNEICQNFEQLAIQKNISFTYPKAKEKCSIWVDKEKIDSVLFNILSNAFKFTKNKKSINVSLVELDNQLDIIITDEGMGISKDKLPLIFKRFNSFSADDIEFSGTGLGLAYSYELIKMHQGDIKVESTVGIGSSFKIIIPKGNEHFSDNDILSDDSLYTNNYWHAKEYSLENTLTLDKTYAGGNEKKYTILIVEDNIEVANYLESILETSFKVYYANNGAEGLELITKIHPDIIITDVMMPVMDGTTMTKMVKEDFSISHIPVIMLTAKSDINDQIIGIESGAEAYVLKPFNASHLFSIIKNLIKQRENLAKKFRSNSLTSEIKITNKDEEFLKNLVKIIEENCQDKSFNVQTLIDNSSLGRTVFFNKVKGLTGYSPVEFLRKIKLNIAEKHLSENNSGVAEAAYISGFNDVKHFSKCFKKEYGMNPSQYRKSIINL